MDMNIAVPLEELAVMNFSYAIEDSLSMAEFISKEMKTEVALFDRPWNRRQELNGDIRRFFSWKEIESLIQ